MVYNIVDCTFNVYDKAYTLTVDVHDPVSHTTRSYEMTFPENTVSTEANVKASVELFVQQTKRSIHDWSGLTWNAAA